MAVDYATVKTTIAAWVSAVAGQYLAQDENGDPYVFWEEDSHDYQLAPYALLRLQNGGKQGKDYLSFDYDSTDDTLHPRVRGNRQVIIGIEIRSRETTAPRSALDDLRASLEHDVYMQNLHDGGLAFVQIENAQDGIGIIYDERTEALALLEIRFGVTSTFYDANLSVLPINGACTTQRLRNINGDLIDPGAAEVCVSVSNLIYLDEAQVYLGAEDLRI